MYNVIILLIAVLTLAACGGSTDESPEVTIDVQATIDAGITKDLKENPEATAAPIPTPTATATPESTSTPITFSPTGSVTFDSVLFASVELAEIISNPSDQFIIDSDGLTKVSRASPFIGGNEPSAHAGAHLNFSTESTPYLVNIYAPADGTISNIQNCYDLGNGNDKYGMVLAFATHEGSKVSLSLSLEPFGGYLCQDDKDYYKQYIFVVKGQSVKKGDVIAKLYKPDAKSDSTHIHFHVSSKLSGGFHCPNIFTPSINNDFKNVSGGKTLCYKPVEGEDLTGL